MEEIDYKASYKAMKAGIQELERKAEKLRGEAADYWHESSRIREEAERLRLKAGKLYEEGVRCKKEADDLESKMLVNER